MALAVWMWMWFVIAIRFGMAFVFAVAVARMIVTMVLLWTIHYVHHSGRCWNGHWNGYRNGHWNGHLQKYCDINVDKALKHRKVQNR